MNRARVLAAAQAIPRRGDVDANVEHHARLVEAAAQEGTRVLVFPELSLTGYELDLAAGLAFDEDDDRLRPLRALSRIHRMTLVVGAPVWSAVGLHIGAFILAPNGSVSLYTKRHFGAGEEALVQAGTRDPLVGIGGGTAAVAVCADANRPSHAQEAADRGADTYLVSSFITPSELETRTASLRGYARRHSMTVVFANYGGPSGGLAAGGRSAVWSDDGEPIVRLDGPGCGLAVAIERDRGWEGRTVDLGEV